MDETKIEPKPTVADRRKYLVDLYLTGGTFRDIADTALDRWGKDGLPPSWNERHCYSDIKKELERRRKDLASDLPEKRELAEMRLDTLLTRIFPVALGTEEMPPDTRAITAVLRIEKRRAELLGLDAPTKQEITGQGGGPMAFAFTSSLSRVYGDKEPETGGNGDSYLSDLSNDSEPY